MWCDNEKKQERVDVGPGEEEEIVEVVEAQTEEVV
jgi:hypothetical protein